MLIIGSLVTIVLLASELSTSFPIEHLGYSPYFLTSGIVILVVCTPLALLVIKLPKEGVEEEEEHNAQEESPLAHHGGDHRFIYLPRDQLNSCGQSK